MKNNIKEIEVKIEKEEFEKALENTLEKKLQNFQMDGFRKGKVPKDLYLKKYGKESLYIDAVDSLLPSAYEKALKDVKPIIEPKVDLKEINENGCTFVFTVTEKPEVNIKKYTGLKVKEEEVKVTKEEINAEIDNMLERYSEIAVKEGKVDLAFVSANLQVAKPLRMKILRKYHDILISGNRFGELKDDGKEVSLKELVSYPWISLTAETITRRFLNEYFEKNSLTFTPDMELATTDMILPAVRHNLGLGSIPAEFADSELKSGQVFEIKVKEKLPERNIILIYDKEYPQSIAAKEFQKFLKEKEM